MPQFAFVAKSLKSTTYERYKNLHGCHTHTHTHKERHTRRQTVGLRDRQTATFCQICEEQTNCQVTWAESRAKSTTKADQKQSRAEQSKAKQTKRDETKRKSKNRSRNCKLNIVSTRNALKQDAGDAGGMRHAACGRTLRCCCCHAGRCVAMTDRNSLITIWSHSKAHKRITTIAEMSHNELVKILLPNILRNLTSIFKLGSLCGHTATLPLFTAVATAAPLLVAAVVVVVELLSGCECCCCCSLHWMPLRQGDFCCSGTRRGRQLLCWQMSVLSTLDCIINSSNWMPQSILILRGSVADLKTCYKIVYMNC